MGIGGRHRRRRICTKRQREWRSGHDDLSTASLDGPPPTHRTVWQSERSTGHGGLFAAWLDAAPFSPPPPSFPHYLSTAWHDGPPPPTTAPFGNPPTSLPHRLAGSRSTVSFGCPPVYRTAWLPIPHRLTGTRSTAWFDYRAVWLLPFTAEF